MLPIAILPVAGLLLGIGGSFTNETMLSTYGLTSIMGPGTFLNAIFLVMSDAGNIVFANLPIIFAIGCAIGMAKKEKEVAALAAAIAFFIMHASIGAMITIRGGAETMLSAAVTQVCGITSLQMGVFGGILVGLGVAALHNRFYKIELPKTLSFFGGTRFVPIISGLAYFVVGIISFFVWPFVQQGIYAVGDFVLRSGYVGTWVYGLMERLLIPFGLHHVFYLPFWQTAVGGSMMVAGRFIEGAQNIFFAQLADPTVKHFAVSATRFMSGKFPLMIFGLPGAALAMYNMALPEKKKEVGGLLLSAALTSMLTGITEPIEFTFLFIAPSLYLIHCVFAGAAYMLMHMLGVGVGMTFSGGFIDLFLFGILQGNSKTSWLWVPVVGAAYFAVYYFLFLAIIKKYDLKTPGRDLNAEVKLYGRADYNAKKSKASTDDVSRKIVNGLGGKANLFDVDCCATRLRVTVRKSELVNDSMLKATGASGVVRKGNGVQIIYGPQVSVIKSNLETYLDMAPDVEYAGDAERSDEAAPAQAETSAGKIVKTVIIGSPVSGRAEDLSKAPDEAFANKMMGDGVVVTPDSGKVMAPADGTVLFVFDTKHAIGFKTNDGIEMLIHFGIDTVKLQGQGFKVFVANGQNVRKGDVLMEADLDYVSKNAPSIATPILCTELKANEKLRRIADGNVSAGSDLIAIDIYEG